MLEEIEGLSEIAKPSEEMHDAISPVEADYISECVEGENPSALVDRIDELSAYQPPKGIDSDPAVAEIIEPLKDQLDSKYLEAPGDLEQISQIGDYLTGVDELKFENWQTLTPSERLDVLQKAEYQIAEIEHREPCPITIKDMPEGHLGYFSPSEKTITLNEKYLNANDANSYIETLDTLIHEGRHAYQDYNMTEREVHPRGGEVTNWKWNEYELGYQDAMFYGFEAYAMQPVETDARAFAEDVLKDYLTRTA